MRKKLLLIMLISCALGYSQDEKCATDRLLEIERAKNPVQFDHIRAVLEAYTSKYSQESLSTSKQSIIQIPTVVHVVHNGEAVGTYPNTSDAQIISGITNLNAAFKNTAPYNGSTYYNSPMNIEFVLAQVKPDGSPTTGIERHDVSGKSYGTEYNTNGLSSGTSGVPSGTLMPDYYWNPQDYMNIWLVKKIDGADTGTTGVGTLGYATLPLSNPGITDGLVCQVRAFGYDPNNIASPPFDFGVFPSNGNGTADHEVGHYLNLYHTFTGDAGGASCPTSSGTNVGIDSDGCADIPEHKRTVSVCPGDDVTGNTCTGGDNNYIHNFMDYSSDACFTGFSNDQRTRCQAAIDGPRNAFKTALGHIAPNSSYPAAIAATISTPNPGLGINDITLNGTTFTSRSAYHDGGYLNRVASQPTVILQANITYPMTVQVGVNDGNQNNEIVSVFIDYNNNAIFEASEKVYETAGGSGLKNGAVFSFSFTTPSNGFIANTRLRMRVISDFDSGATPIQDPLETQHGNIEDYSVSIGNVLSVTSNTLENAIKLHPNPAKDFITITGLKKQESYAIYSITGQKVLNGTTNNNERISIQHLSNGMYFFKLTNGNTIKIIKE